MSVITFCQPNETCCVIEEQQSQDGVAIMTYAEIQRTNTSNTILFTGTFEECDNWRSQFTPNNPYLNDVSKAGQELIASANREHIPNWKYFNDKSPKENHKLFSEFCNENNIALEDFVCYIFEEKGIATQDVLTANAIEQDLYSAAIEEDFHK